MELIREVVNRREQMHEKEFKRIFEAIICAYGVEQIIKMYPMTLNGDIGSESFEDDNNLWLLSSFERTES